MSGREATRCAEERAGPRPVKVHVLIVCVFVLKERSARGGEPSEQECGTHVLSCRGLRSIGTHAGFVGIVCSPTVRQKSPWGVWRAVLKVKEWIGKDRCALCAVVEASLPHRESAVTFERVASALCSAEVGDHVVGGAVDDA